jgi:hypothetical protein
MQSDHAKPAVAFAVLVVLAAATVGSGLSQQDADGAEVSAVAPAPGLHEHRPVDRLTPFDPTRTVTLAPRPTSDPLDEPVSGAGTAADTGTAAGEQDSAPESRARRPSRSRTGSTGDTGSGADAPRWSAGNGNDKARGHRSSPSGPKDTPPGHR